MKHRYISERKILEHYLTKVVMEGLLFLFNEVSLFFKQEKS